MNRSDFEAYVKECLDNGVCPSCQTEIDKALDRSTGDVLAVCGRCGYTRIIR